MQQRQPMWQKYGLPPPQSPQGPMVSDARIPDFGMDRYNPNIGTTTQAQRPLRGMDPAAAGNPYTGGAPAGKMQQIVDRTANYQQAPWLQPNAQLNVGMISPENDQYIPYTISQEYDEEIFQYRKAKQNPDDPANAEYIQTFEHSIWPSMARSLVQYDAYDEDRRLANEWNGGNSNISALLQTPIPNLDAGRQKVVEYMGDQAVQNANGEGLWEGWNPLNYIDDIVFGSLQQAQRMAVDPQTIPYLGFHTPWTGTNDSFENWANQNPDLVAQANQQGGGRQVWEAYIGTQGPLNRMASDFVLDPWTWAQIATSGLSRIPQLTRIVEPIDRLINLPDDLFFQAIKLPFRAAGMVPQLPTAIRYGLNMVLKPGSRLFSESIDTPFQDWARMHVTEPFLRGLGKPSSILDPGIHPAIAARMAPPVVPSEMTRQIELGMEWWGNRFRRFGDWRQGHAPAQEAARTASEVEQAMRRKGQATVIDAAERTTDTAYADLDPAWIKANNRREYWKAIGRQLDELTPVEPLLDTPATGPAVDQRKIDNLNVEAEVIHQRRETIRAKIAATDPSDPMIDFHREELRNADEEFQGILARIEEVKNAPSVAPDPVAVTGSGDARLQELYVEEQLARRKLDSARAELDAERSRTWQTDTDDDAEAILRERVFGAEDRLKAAQDQYRARKEELRAGAPVVTVNSNRPLPPPEPGPVYPEGDVGQYDPRNITDIEGRDQYFTHQLAELGRTRPDDVREVWRRIEPILQAYNTAVGRGWTPAIAAHENMMKFEQIAIAILGDDAPVYVIRNKIDTAAGLIERIIFDIEDEVAEQSARDLRGLGPDEANAAEKAMILRNVRQNRAGVRAAKNRKIEEVADTTDIVGDEDLVSTPAPGRTERRRGTYRDPSIRQSPSVVPRRGAKPQPLLAPEKDEVSETINDQAVQEYLDQQPIAPWIPATLETVDRPSPGMIRLYRGQGEQFDSSKLPGWMQDTRGLWFTQDIGKAKTYASGREGGHVVFVDVPERDYPHYAVADRTDEFLLTRAIVDRAQRLDVEETSPVVDQVIDDTPFQDDAPHGEIRSVEELEPGVRRVTITDSSSGGGRTFYEYDEVPEEDYPAWRERILASDDAEVNRRSFLNANGERVVRLYRGGSPEIHQRVSAGEDVEAFGGQWFTTDPKVATEYQSQSRRGKGFGDHRGADIDAQIYYVDIPVEQALQSHVLRMLGYDDVKRFGKSPQPGMDGFGDFILPVEDVRNAGMVSGIRDPRWDEISNPVDADQLINDTPFQDVPEARNVQYGPRRPAAQGTGVHADVQSGTAFEAPDTAASVDVDVVVNDLDQALEDARPPSSRTLSVEATRKQERAYLDEKIRKTADLLEKAYYDNHPNKIANLKAELSYWETRRHASITGDKRGIAHVQTREGRPDYAASDPEGEKVIWKNQKKWYMWASKKYKLDAYADAVDEFNRGLRQTKPGTDDDVLRAKILKQSPEISEEDLQKRLVKMRVSGPDDEWLNIMFKVRQKYLFGLFMTDTSPMMMIDTSKVIEDPVTGVKTVIPEEKWIKNPTISIKIDNFINNIWPRMRDEGLEKGLLIPWTGLHKVKAAPANKETLNALGFADEFELKRAQQPYTDTINLNSAISHYRNFVNPGAKAMDKQNATRFFRSAWPSQKELNPAGWQQWKPGAEGTIRNLVTKQGYTGKMTAADLVEQALREAAEARRLESIQYAGERPPDWPKDQSIYNEDFRTPGSIDRSGRFVDEDFQDYLARHNKWEQHKARHPESTMPEPMPHGSRNEQVIYQPRPPDEVQWEAFLVYQNMPESVRKGNTWFQLTNENREYAFDTVADYDEDLKEWVSKIPDADPDLQMRMLARWDPVRHEKIMRRVNELSARYKDYISWRSAIREDIQRIVDDLPEYQGLSGPDRMRVVDARLDEQITMQSYEKMVVGETPQFHIDYLGDDIDEPTFVEETLSKMEVVEVLDLVNNNIRKRLNIPDDASMAIWEDALDAAKTSTLAEVVNGMDEAFNLLNIDEEDLGGDYARIYLKAQQVHREREMMEIIQAGLRPGQHARTIKNPRVGIQPDPVPAHPAWVQQKPGPFMPITVGGQPGLVRPGDRPLPNPYEKYDLLTPAANQAGIPNQPTPIQEYGEGAYPGMPQQVNKGWYRKDKAETLGILPPEMVDLINTNWGRPSLKQAIKTVRKAMKGVELQSYISTNMMDAAERSRLTRIGLSQQRGRGERIMAKMENVELEGRIMQAPLSDYDHDLLRRKFEKNAHFKDKTYHEAWLSIADRIEWQRKRILELAAKADKDAGELDELQRLRNTLGQYGNPDDFSLQSINYMQRDLFHRAIREELLVKQVGGFWERLGGKYKVIADFNAWRADLDKGNKHTALHPTNAIKSPGDAYNTAIGTYSVTKLLNPLNFIKFIWQNWIGNSFQLLAHGEGEIIGKQWGMHRHMLEEHGVLSKKSRKLFDEQWEGPTFNLDNTPMGEMMKLSEYGGHNPNTQITSTMANMAGQAHLDKAVQRARRELPLPKGARRYFDGAGATMSAMESTTRTTLWGHHFQTGLVRRKPDMLNRLKEMNRSKTFENTFRDEDLDLLFDAMNPVFGPVTLRLNLERLAKVKGVADQDAHKFADRAARDWANMQKAADDEAYDRVKKVLFSYEYNNLDSMVRKVIPFHFWATRAIPFYATLAVKNPWLANAYLNFSDGLAKAAEEEGAPDYVKTAISVLGTPYGYAMFFNPITAIGMISMFENDLDRAPDGESWIGKLLRNMSNYGGLMVYPWIGATLNYAGALGESNSYMDPTGFSGERKKLGAFMQWAATQGFWPGDAEMAGAPVETWLRTVREMTTKYLPGVDTIDAVDPMLGKERDFTYLLMDIVAERDGLPEDAGLTADQMEEVVAARDDPSSDLYQDALELYAGSGALTALLNSVVPGWMVNRPEREGEITRAADLAWDNPENQDFLNQYRQETGKEYTAGGLVPERDLAILQSQVSSATQEHATLLIQQLEYRNLGNRQEQETWETWQSIRYGNGTRPVKIGGQTWAPVRIAHLDDEGKKALAAQWLAEDPSRQEEFDRYQNLRDSYVASHAEFGRYEQWRDSVYQMPSLESYRQDLARNNPSAKAYFDTERKKILEKGPITTRELMAQMDQKTTTLEAYEAIYGIARTGYDKVLPVAVDTEGAYDPVQFTETGETSSSTPYPESEIDVEDAATRVYEANIYLSNYLGEQVNILDPFNPNPQRLLDLLPPNLRLTLDEIDYVSYVLAAD